MSPPPVTREYANDSRVPFGPSAGEIVELGLFLTASQAQALIALSRARRQSVAELLRGLIRRELDDVIDIDEY